MLPEVTVPAPVVTLAWVTAVAIWVGSTPSAATFAGSSRISSCICCTPDRVTACTPSMPCRRGTTRVPSSAASCSAGSSDETASWITGMLLKLRAATAGAWAVAGSICCTPEIACWTSASFSCMSVPNSYSIVMMLTPSLENESNALTPLVALTACSSGVVMVRSTSLGDDPGATVNTVRYGKVRSGMSSCLRPVMAKAPNSSTASTASPTMERLRRAIFVSQLKGCLRGRSCRYGEAAWPARRRGAPASGSSGPASPP